MIVYQMEMNMTDVSFVHEGNRFLHSQIRDRSYAKRGQKHPATCIVLRIANGMVYYAIKHKKGTLGVTRSCQLDDFYKICQVIFFK